MNEDEVFDDACDLGQFFVNPTYFLFVKIRTALTRQKNAKIHGTDTSLDKSEKQRQPLLSPRIQQLLYLCGVYGCWIVIFLRCYPLQKIHREKVADIHRTIGYVTFFLCVFSWIVASLSMPGDINQKTLSQFDNYPYDSILYHDDCVCPTIHIRKLARSKFDRYTQRQVPRFDHFCGWLNQCIGENNYRSFLGFLVVHTFACVYGSIITGRLLFVAETIDSPLAVAFVFISIMALTLVHFLTFHLRNIANGMTANEYYKWKRILQTNSSSVETISMPRNIYNLGVGRNFLEVLLPRSLSTKSKHV